MMRSLTKALAVAIGLMLVTGATQAQTAGDMTKAATDAATRAAQDAATKAASDAVNKAVGTSSSSSKPNPNAGVYGGQSGEHRQDMEHRKDGDRGGKKDKKEKKEKKGKD